MILSKPPETNGATRSATHTTGISPNAQKIRDCLGLSRFIPSSRISFRGLDDFQHDVAHKFGALAAFQLFGAYLVQPLYNSALLIGVERDELSIISRGKHYLAS
jgi:hypothetical protein